MSSRTRLAFKVRINQAGELIDVYISDPSKIAADNLGLATWGSSEVLANVLHRIDVDLKGWSALQGSIPILELGAGTGLVGMSAAAVWRTSVVLTDLHPILPNIEANIELNRNQLARRGGSAICGILDWAHPNRLVLSQRSGNTDDIAVIDEALPDFDDRSAQIILAADTVYSEEHPALLIHVIKRRLEPGPDSRLVLCYPLRIGNLDYIRDLWQRLEDAGLVCIEEGREKKEESWDEEAPYEWCVWRWRDAGQP